MIRQLKRMVEKVLQTVLLPIETKRYVGVTVWLNPPSSSLKIMALYSPLIHIEKIIRS